MAYHIGDKAHGGIVFCVSQDGEHGLVAAETDQSTGANWEAAIKICSELDLNGFKDWFLPSKDLLNLMWKHLHKFRCPSTAPDDVPCPYALGDFAAMHYWSSSSVENSGGKVYKQSFHDGTQSMMFMSDKIHVRAVRAF